MIRIARGSLSFVVSAGLLALLGLASPAAGAGGQFLAKIQSLNKENNIGGGIQSQPHELIDHRGAYGMRLQAITPGVTESYITQSVVFRGSRLNVSRHVELDWVVPGSFSFELPIMIAATSMGIYYNHPGAGYTWTISQNTQYTATAFPANSSHATWDIFSGLPNGYTAYTRSGSSNASTPTEFQGQNYYITNFGSFPEDTRSTTLQVAQNGANGETHHYGAAIDDFIQVEIRIDGGQPPNMNLIVPPGQIFFAGLPADMSAEAFNTGSPVGTDIIDYLWTATGNPTIVGDGTANARLTWDLPGTYEVNVTAWNDKGWEVTESLSVTVVPEPSSLVLLVLGLTGFARIRGSH